MVKQNKKQIKKNKEFIELPKPVEEQKVRQYFYMITFEYERYRKNFWGNLVRLPNGIFSVQGILNDWENSRKDVIFKKIKNDVLEYNPNITEAYAITFYRLEEMK